MVNDKNLDVSDPASLEAALEAAPLDALARVENEAGSFLLRRVPGGWYLPGDLAVSSADVVEGAPTSVRLWERPTYSLHGEDPFDEEDYR